MDRIRRMLCILALLAPAARAAAQPADTARTARIAYRTRDILFVSAGRAEGLAVGDTIACVALGTVIARAVVTSVATHSAAARLLDDAAGVREGQSVTWRPRAALAAAAPVADSAARPPAESGAASIDTPAPVVRAASPRRRRAATGGVQVEHGTASAGGVSSAQTMAALDLRVPLPAGAELRMRSTARHRAGTRIPETGPLSLVAYELSARVGHPRARWSATLGRFVPAEAMALGYIDGVQINRRTGASGRLGVVAGFVPLADRLRPSAATTRAGLFWVVTSGPVLDARLAAAADWAAGARRRTQLAAQTSWYPSHGVGLSLYGDADLGAPWDSTAGPRLTGAHASASFALPLGVRATLGAESRQAIRLWETWVPGDTTPLPGRIIGFNASLGRALAGVSVTAGGGWLRRAGDPAGTVRGNLSVAGRTLFVTVVGQHGDLLDYGAATGRWLLRTRGPGPALSLGAAATMTRARGGVTFWRYALRPELAWSPRHRWYATAGADLGRYAGRADTWVHTGVSYRFH